MVFADAADTTLFPLEPETRHRNWFRNPGALNASRESDVSWLGLRRLCIGIESANQHVSVFLCACGQVRNKGLDQISIRFFQGWRAAEISGICLDEGGIEIVLADQQTQLIPQAGLAIVGSVGRVFRRRFAIHPRIRVTRRRSQLLDRAEADAVSL